MKKNDITYEYRVFTNRPIDVESMEVGRCTSKVLKELKKKDKVDGRFFHTTDSDEWFFCWKGNLQKLNLKGDSDVNAALEEVNRLIAEANIAVDEAKKTADEAKVAADAAKEAADNATAAVESIENKADKSVVDELVQTVGEKANQSTVDELSAKVEAIPSKEEIALKSDLDGYVKSEDMPEIPSLDGYATEEFVLNKIAEAELNDKDIDLSNYVTKSDIANFVTKDEVPSVEGLATTTYVDEKVAEIKVPSIDNLATKEEIAGVKTWVNEQGFLTEHQDISGKQDVIGDLEDIRLGAAAGATALQEIPAEYITESELNDKGYLTEESLNGFAKESDLANYFTKEEINNMFDSINDLIGEATTITNTILA